MDINIINLVKLLIIIYILFMEQINFDINNFIMKFIILLIITYTTYNNKGDYFLSILLMFAFLLNINYNCKKKFMIINDNLKFYII
jgi:hypothetical protein